MPDKTYLNWPFLDDEHRKFAVDLRAWAENEIPPYAEEAHGQRDVDDICKRLAIKLGDAGWLKYMVPAAQGGAEALMSPCRIGAKPEVPEDAEVLSGRPPPAFGLKSCRYGIFSAEILRFLRILRFPAQKEVRDSEKYEEKKSASMRKQPQDPQEPQGPQVPVPRVGALPDSRASTSVQSRNGGQRKWSRLSCPCNSM